MTDQRKDPPAGLVVEELQVVALEVEQTPHQREEQGQRQGARVVGRAEHSDLIMAYKIYISVILC